MQAIVRCKLKPVELLFYLKKQCFHRVPPPLVEIFERVGGPPPSGEIVPFHEIESPPLGNQGSLLQVRQVAGAEQERSGMEACWGGSSRLGAA